MATRKLRPTFRDARAVAEALTPSYPIYCVKPKVLEASARRFLELFPGRVLYAVKCNPHPRVVQALYDAGIRHFDVASLPEIAQVREMFRDAEPYFMHPVKGRAVIQSAREVYGVRQYVIDHDDELTKLLEETHDDGLTVVVRMQTPKTEALYDLSAKFGAPPDEAVALLKRVAKEGLTPGLAFHVGSQCTTLLAYTKAMEMAADVITRSGVALHVLDVGGGFPAAYPGTQAPPLETYIDEILRAAKAMKLRNDCVLMCEPGRAMVAEGMSLLVQVQLRKEGQVYINDGLYGGLSETKVANIRLPVRAIRLDGAFADKSAEFMLNGPTCDSIDVLPHAYALPADIREGDWIEIEQVGAYSNANATRFNGFHTDTFVEIEAA
ncbi:MAG: type III PLP-dependent enzyme [Alphaproteobacteria bacterium]|nr:type III PLP-dependent enzyme [Alphaproteobacteria bacterium]